MTRTLSFVMLGTAVAVCAGAVGLPADARAATVPLVSNTVGATTTVLLDDNFESPAAPADPDNGALPGTWVSIYDTESGGNSFVQTWSAAQAPNVAAFEGSQYANVYRNGAYNTQFIGLFESPSSAGTGTLHAEFALYVSSSDDVASVILSSSNYTYAISLAAGATTGGAVIQNLSDDTTVDTGVDFSLDQWQVWQIDVDLATWQFALTVDDSSASDLAVQQAPGSFGSLRIGPGNNWNPGIYVDAVPVPEPASLGLLGFGAAALLRRPSQRRA